MMTAMAPLLTTSDADTTSFSLVERLLQQQQEFVILQREHERVRASLTAQLSTLSAAAAAKSNAQIQQLEEERDLTALQARLEALYGSKLLTDVSHFTSKSQSNLECYVGLSWI